MISTHLDPRIEVGLHRLLADDAAGQVHPAIAIYDRKKGKREKGINNTYAVVSYILQ